MSIFSISRVLTQLCVLFSLLCQPALAHEVPATKVILDIGVKAIGMEMQMPLNELQLVFDDQASVGSEAWLQSHKASLNQYIAQHLELSTADGLVFPIKIQNLVSRHSDKGDWVDAKLLFTAPSQTPIDQVLLKDDVITSKVVTHNILVSVRSDFRRGIINSGDKAESTESLPLVGLLHYQQKQLELKAEPGSWFNGFCKLFNMGVQHIAEGADHLLFLLTLLLVAPVRALNHGWVADVSIGRSLLNVGKTVTGFTLGHSLTLALVATGLLNVSARPIEILIAVSILVSALHAWRPLFSGKLSGKEHWIATGFGLIHGMAFAASLQGFNYDARVLGLSILGFNLGIEAMQLAIVALVMPGILLFSRTTGFTPLRLSAAFIAGLLALGWLAERSLGINNPFDVLIQQASHHAAIGIALFTLAGVMVWAAQRVQSAQSAKPQLHYKDQMFL